MEVYFDNSATTRVDDDVIEAMAIAMRDNYGNPSSKHMMGVTSEEMLKGVQEGIAGILKVNPKEIVFTSGGTEANNMAIIGTALANMRRGRHLITTKIEHDSVLEAFKYLENMKLPENVDPEGKGFQVTYLDVDENAMVDPARLEAAMRPDTTLVSVMYVNNEVGSVQNIRELSRVAKGKSPECIFHSDAVQAFGKYVINPNKEGIDLLSISAHKFHGPKGAGALYVKSNTKINPIIFGGGQQKGLRSGTENVPGYVGMGLAAQNAGLNADVSSRLAEIKEYIIKELVARSEAGAFGKCHISINSPAGELSSPAILNVSFEPIKSEVLLHALEERGIYVSSGSACSSNRKSKSHVLSAMGLSKSRADCALRLSFSKYNTLEEAKYFIEVLKELLPVLSKFTSH